MKTPTLERPKWSAVVLVCKDCSKRGSGPRDLKAKALKATARKRLKLPGTRARVLTTGCLGLCPKAATAVAFAGDDLVTRIVAVRSTAQLDEAIGLLAAERDGVVTPPG